MITGLIKSVNAKPRPVCKMPQQKLMKMLKVVMPYLHTFLVVKLV